MNYPVEELLEDYEIWSNPAIPLGETTQEQFFGLLSAFYTIRYPGDSNKSNERCRAMRKAMALIWNSQEDLHREKLIAKRPAKYGTLFSMPILSAAHDLVNIKGIEQPTVEQMKEAARKFGWTPSTT